MFSMFAAVNRRKSLSKISKTVFLSAYDVYLLHCGIFRNRAGKGKSVAVGCVVSGMGEVMEPVQSKGGGTGC